MNDDFKKELLAAFHAEAEEHLAAIGAGLQALEKEGALSADEQAATVETIYRDAHSLKGAARAVDLPGVGAVCQALEGLFSAWKNRRLAIAAGAFPPAYAALDVVHNFIASGQDEAAVAGLQPEKWIQPLEQLVAGLPAAGAAAPAPPSPPLPPEPAPPSREPAATAPAAVPPAAPVQQGGTLRVAAAKLDRIMRQAEELLMAKQDAARHARTLRELLERIRLDAGEWEKFLPELRALQRRVTQSGQAAATAERDGGRLQEAALRYVDGFKDVAESVEAAARAAEDDHRALARMADDLLDGAKDVLMVPASTVFQGLPHMVREIARSLGKEVDFIMAGQDLEIDRRILEEMKDPMRHLLRNAVDHGIEPPEVRRREGKPERGRVFVTLSQTEGRQVVITVADDGGGVPLERLKESAVRGGFITRSEAEQMDEQAALMLMFRSSVSTRSAVTDLSGRGLGMAIVQEKVERLGGVVEVASYAGLGTEFRLVLPLSLATFRGVLVRAGGWRLALPSASVERVLRMTAADIRTVENRETALVAGAVVPFVRLAAVLDLPAAAEPPSGGHLSAVLMGRGNRQLLLAVDGLEDEQELLVKSLGALLPRVRNVAGAAILADGQPVPVLHPQDLLASSLRCAAKSPPVSAAVPAAAGAAPRRPAVLVAEDSITSRMLIKNILETDGFDVHAAGDGMEAWALLKSRPFDAVISDIDMPRLDGFALTERIRGNPAWTDLPVILVTARESREDRERGLMAGANAYVAKSRFDQSNLLAVLHSLL